MGLYVYESNKVFEKNIKMSKKEAVLKIETASKKIICYFQLPGVLMHELLMVIRTM